MRKKVFGQPVSAIDVERLRADIGPTHFVRLCGALIGDALADRVGSFALPQISERINVPDGGVDAGYTTPDSLSVPETGGLIGPGTTVYQFKYRDASATSRSAIVQKLARQLRDDFSRAVPPCDRYVLLTNIDLSGAQSRKLRDSLVESSPAFEGKLILIWGAAEIAVALNQAPHLHHLFFSEGGLCTLDFAEEELKAAYKKVGWPPFAGREQERAAISTFIKDETVQLLHVIGPRYVGKTRLVIEALKPTATSVLWAASPDDVTLDLLRDLDSSDTKTIFVIDCCGDSLVRELDEWARARRQLKTIMIRDRSSAGEIARKHEILLVAPLGNQEARRLLAAVAPGLPFAQESWVVEGAGGLPGHLLHIGTILKEARGFTLASPGEIRKQLGMLLEEQYLTGLPPEARRAIEAASLLPVLGIEGEMGKEVEAVCRALDLAPGTLAAHLPLLERVGVVRRRGRFIEVVPPKLAEYLASRGLNRPERVLAELQVALEPGAFLRFLERFRNLPSDGVKEAIDKLLSGGEWFDDLNALIRNAKKLEILAPAAPIPALRCIERILEGLSVGELTTRLIKDARRSLVSALEDLALRSETFEGAVRLLLVLAEAETEIWANNATGVLLSLLHWQHPEVTVSLARRLGVLQDGAQSNSALRRKLVAAACGEAFREGVTISLHHPKGPTLPEKPYRAATWDEVGQYACGILDLLTRLSQDADPQVHEAAIASLRNCFWPFVNISLRLPAAGSELPELGRNAFKLLEKAGQTAQHAQARADIVSLLERTIEALPGAATSDVPAAQQAFTLAKDLHRHLTESNFRDKLWRWIGTESWKLHRGRVAEADASSAIKSIASEFLQNPHLFTSHLEWLTGEEARQGPQLFQILGEIDRGSELFKSLLTRSTRPHWSQAFSAYLVGWGRTDLPGAERALDYLTDTHLEPAEGIIRATCSLPPSDETASRILRVVEKNPTQRTELISQISLFMQWHKLSAEATAQLISALDDGTRKVRSLLLSAFTTRVFRNSAMTPSLKELAWSFLRSAFPDQVGEGGHEWDMLAAELGKQESQRLLCLVEELAITHLKDGFQRFNWEHELPLVWETLEEANRQGVLWMLLRLTMTANIPYWIDRKLSQMIDPSRDRETLLHFVRDAGVEGAQAIALNLEADKPGFWELARDLIVESGDDERVKDRLLANVMSGGEWGSAVPRIDARLAQVRPLLNDSDPKVATWAQQAVSSLEERRQRAEREDWIWDYRIRRSELEAMVKQKDSPERLWAIGRLLKDAPKERVLELLTPEEILDALPKIQNLDERTRRMWEGWARHWSTRH